MAWTYPEETTADHASCSTDELVLQVFHRLGYPRSSRQRLDLSRPRLKPRSVHLSSALRFLLSSTHQAGRSRTHEFLQKEARIQDQARTVESDRTTRIPRRLAEQGDDIHRR